DGAGVRQQKSDQRSATDDEWERRGKEEDGSKSRASDRDIVGAAQSTARDPEKRFDDDYQHCGLDAKERDLDERHLPVEPIGNAESEHDESAGQHEEQACGEPS